MAERLGRLEATRAATLGALDCLPTGIILIGGDQDLLDSNAAARRIVAAADGLSVANGKLRCAASSEAARLREILARATSSNGPLSEQRPGGAMTVTRLSGERPHTVLVGPLSGARRVAGKDVPAAVVFVSDPDSCSASPDEILRQLYGLTAAEASIAMPRVRSKRGQFRLHLMPIAGDAPWVAAGTEHWYKQSEWGFPKLLT